MNMATFKKVFPFSPESGPLPVRRCLPDPSREGDRPLPPFGLQAGLGGLRLLGLGPHWEEGMEKSQFAFNSRKIVLYIKFSQSFADIKLEVEYKPEIVLERDFVQARNGERVSFVRFLEFIFGRNANIFHF